MKPYSLGLGRAAYTTDKGLWVTHHISSLSISGERKFLSIPTLINISPETVILQDSCIFKSCTAVIWKKKDRNLYYENFTQSAQNLNVFLYRLFSFLYKQGEAKMVKMGHAEKPNLIHTVLSN